MSHVFISYVRENQTEVSRLRRDLSRHHIDVWLDREQIEPGTIWKDAIRAAIRNGSYFIACFSGEYQSKIRSYMNEELTLAIEAIRQLPHGRTWFIPVLLSESDVPARDVGGGHTLLDFQWVPLYQNWEDGIKRIVSVINSDEKRAMKCRLNDLAREMFRLDSIMDNYDLSPDDSRRELPEHDKYEKAKQEYCELLDQYESEFGEQYVSP